MKKLMLTRAWVFAGTVYGPGEVEVPDDVAKVLQEKDAEAKKAAEAAVEVKPGDVRLQGDPENPITDDDGEPVDLGLPEPAAPADEPKRGRK